MFDSLTVPCFVFLRHVARLEELFFGTSHKEEDEEDSRTALPPWNASILN